LFVSKNPPPPRKSKKVPPQFQSYSPVLKGNKSQQSTKIKKKMSGTKKQKKTVKLKLVT
jgi:hypothetical protein